MAPIVRALVLAHQIERAVADGRAASYAEVARAMGVSRARVAQWVALTRLAPVLQERLLDPHTDPVGLRRIRERCLRRIAAERDPVVQTAEFEKLWQDAQLRARRSRRAASIDGRPHE